MSDDLIAVEDMAEIPKDLTSAQGKSGCSKGVNLFLARQKLIADMMEQEDNEQSESQELRGAGATSGRISTDSGAHTVNPAFVMITADDRKKQSAEAISEIPDVSASESGGGKSKGVNLFLARQKLIADMMAAEEEEARAAEEAKILQAEQERKQEELRRKKEAENARLEELKRLEREKLEESERKKAARAAKFKTGKALPAEEKEPDLPWVKKKSSNSSSSSGNQRKTLYQLLSADKK